MTPQSWIDSSSGMKLCAVALGQMAADAKIARQVAPGLATPVDAGAPDAVAGLERAPLPDRQSRLLVAVAEGQRALRRPLKEIEPDPIAQLIRRIADVERGGGVTPRTTLDCNDIEPLIGELVSREWRRSSRGR